MALRKESLPEGRSARLVPLLLSAGYHVFVDLTEAWSVRLRAIASDERPRLRQGVYAMLGGPHYETWAEAQWLRRLGADLVGMSTVYEAIAAREWGVELAGLSTVTAIEGTESGIDPDEVVAVAESTAGKLGPLLVALVQRGLDER